MKIVQAADGGPKAAGPYSIAIISGNLVFTSGQIAAGEDGNLVGSNITEQTEQVVKNLTSVLKSAGSSLSNVVKATCFLADMNDFAAFNEVYVKHFTGKPARTTIGVKQLPRNAIVEIEVIAEIN